MIYESSDYIANINSYGSYSNIDGLEDKRALITTTKNIAGLVSVDDEIKIVLNNDNKENQEFEIDSTPYKNRYRRRYAKVLEVIDDYSFVINQELDIPDNDPLFIYGKKVDDFKHLDYQSFHALNTSAIQELYKIIERQQEQINFLMNK